MNMDTKTEKEIKLGLHKLTHRIGMTIETNKFVKYLPEEEQLKKYQEYEILLLLQGLRAIEGIEKIAGIVESNIKCWEKEIKIMEELIKKDSSESYYAIKLYESDDSIKDLIEYANSIYGINGSFSTTANDFYEFAKLIKQLGGHFNLRLVLDMYDPEKYEHEMYLREVGFAGSRDAADKFYSHKKKTTKQLAWAFTVINYLMQNSYDPSTYGTNPEKYKKMQTLHDFRGEEIVTGLQTIEGEHFTYDFIEILTKADCALKKYKETIKKVKNVKYL